MLKIALRLFKTVPKAPPQYKQEKRVFMQKTRGFKHSFAGLKELVLICGVV
jgi:hypothetical protein